MVLTAVAFSILAGVICLAFTDQVLTFLGAGADTWGHARQYITVLLCFMPMSMLQCLFQSFLVTAGRPGLGLGLTVGAGFANMVLDYVFIVPLGMGIAGAALATAIGYCIPALADSGSSPGTAPACALPVPAGTSLSCSKAVPTALRRWSPIWLPASSPSSST